MVTHLGSRFTLTVPFSVPYEEMWAKDLTVKIVLPEHARDVQVNVPFEAQEVRYRYLSNIHLSIHAYIFQIGRTRRMSKAV